MSTASQVGNYALVLLLSWPSGVPAGFCAANITRLEGFAEFNDIDAKIQES
jgi:hypothetical protein